MNKKAINIYSDDFVKDLFDGMSKTYVLMNLITSFGFSYLWRIQAIRKLNLQNKENVIDLLSGTGENWKYLKKLSKGISITSLDFSEQMINKSKLRQKKSLFKDVILLNQNILENNLLTNEYDAIISTFSFKTFDIDKINQFAIEIERILKPGGEFSLIDISVPNNKVLRFFYMFYLKKIIPILGFFFLGNPDEYRLLGQYTELFGNAEQILPIFKKRNLVVKYESYFFGCATGISGVKK